MQIPPLAFIIIGIIVVSISVVISIAKRTWSMAAFIVAGLAMLVYGLIRRAG